MPIAPDATTTLRSVLKDGGWVILNCDNPACGRRVASRLPKFIERFGANASTNVVRANAVCTVCGTKGCTMTTPSWAGRDKGWAEFPGEGEEVTASSLTASAPSR